MTSSNAVCHMSMQLAVLLVACSIGGTSCAQQHSPHSGDSMDTNVVNAMRATLDRDFSLWYPACLDTVYGGYFSDFDYGWNVDGRQQKMIVTQARHVWSTANAAMFYGDRKDLLAYGKHGVAFLRDVMWDKEYGGFYDLVTRRGEPIEEHGVIVKRAYGNAFAIYGLAAYAHATGDTAALHLAQRAFAWLDAHSYDPVHGGYYQFLSREGIPMRQGFGGDPPKDQNSSIHILEALTELSHVWPSPLVQERLAAMLRLVRDTITGPKPYMTLFFDEAWHPVSFRDASAEERERNYEYDHVSFGHDVETAYLMLEASEALGEHNDTVTLQTGKRMVDHAIAYGWDKERGGIYDGGYYFKGNTTPSIVRNTKEWWGQVEAMNSFLLMAMEFPHDPQDYYGKFLRQWEYCTKYLLDHEHGGWYWGGIDIVPRNATLPKATIWKADYHTSRSLINCIRMIEQQRSHWRK